MRLRCAALGDLWRRSGGEIEEETKWEKEEDFDKEDATPDISTLVQLI